MEEIVSFILYLPSIQNFRTDRQSIRVALILKPVNSPNVVKALKSTKVKDFQVLNSVLTMKSQCLRISNPHMKSAAFMSHGSMVEINLQYLR